MADAPAFDIMVWNTVAQEVRSSVLVCHNAMFDTAVLCACLSHYQLPAPDAIYLYGKGGPARMAGAENHKLDTVSAALGIELNHHEACSDARAAGWILQAALQKRGARTRMRSRRRSGYWLGGSRPWGRRLQHRKKDIRIEIRCDRFHIFVKGEKSYEKLSGFHRP